MRILDMTQYEAGTSCTQFLAWLGADVVKIESPRGDPGRQVYGRIVKDSQYFLNYNSNKRSVVIDLQTDEGRQLLLDMVPHYDVFVENFGPDVMERLNIGYDVMRGLNPRIVYTRIKGFGLSGPHAHFKTFDALAQASAGVFSITGWPDGPPLRPGPTYGDTGTGAQAALAISAAYTQLQRTGLGQEIEISMQEATTSFMRTATLTQPDAPWAGEVAMGRRGNGAGPPSGMYPCKPEGPNDYIFLMVGTSRMWDAFCAAIERPDLAVDERFLDPRDRRTRQDELYEEIVPWMLEHEKFEAMHILGDAGVPCSAIYDTADLFSDEHLKERGFIHHLEHPVEGEITLLGQPYRLSESDVPITPAPQFGEHTDAVLTDDLGLDASKLDALRESGVIC
jgi:formyl-CoA transferase